MLLVLEKTPALQKKSSPSDSPTWPFVSPIATHVPRADAEVAAAL